MELLDKSSTKTSDSQNKTVKFALKVSFALTKLSTEELIEKKSLKKDSKDFDKWKSWRYWNFLVFSVPEKANRKNRNTDFFEKVSSLRNCVDQDFDKNPALRFGKRLHPEIEKKIYSIHCQVSIGMIASWIPCWVWCSSALGQLSTVKDLRRGKSRMVREQRDFEHGKK